MIGQTVSHYRILNRIGEGGMGVVYVAEDARLGRRVAIKFPLTGSDEKHYRARFLREARAVSALNHPNIAAVYDFGETDGQPYIVMELVTGQSLADLLAAGLTLGRAVEIIQDVAAALAEAHRRGIVHRDIKPTNVHVGERGEVKVLDFGLAKQMDEEALPESPDAAGSLFLRTRSDVVIGTPLYLSPEQARGARVDARSDLFTLGVLLYECVAGRPPFSGANVIEIGAEVLHVNPPPPSHLNPRVSAELDRVVMKALAKKPEERYQSAEELIAALEPVRARLAGGDTQQRTRRLTAQTPLRSSAFLTISDTLRKPRFSPLVLIAAIAVAFLGVWAYAYLRRPAAHEPGPEAVQFYKRGTEAMRDGSYHTASVALSEAVRLDDEFALAHARLAEAWEELDFRERAMDELLKLGAHGDGRAGLSELDALYLDAITLTVRRKHKEAVELYQKIAQLRPQSPDVYLDLGRAHEKNNETERAVEHYREATTRDPSYAAAYLRLGALYGRQQNFAGARSAFQQAEKIYAATANEEGRAEVLYQRGLLSNKFGRFAEAKRELQQSLEIARVSGNRYQQALALVQLSVASSSETNYTQAMEDARRAVEIAQTGGMPNLTVRGMNALGTAHFNAGEHAEAEKDYSRALELARSNRLGRLEAMTLFNLGSLFIRQGRTDEGLSLVEQARDFYQRGGYLKDVSTAALLIARTKRQKGDYVGALRAFEEQLELAGLAGDMLQLGHTHRELGTVHLMVGNYPEALKHFIECHAIYKSLDDKANVAYSLAKQSDAHWRLGHGGEARGALAQAAALSGDPGGSNKELISYLYLVEAYQALSQRRFAEATAKSRQALEIGAQFNDVVIEVKRISGLVAAFSGASVKGKALCEDAARKAQESGDVLLTWVTHLSLAEALYETGDSQGALDAALRAQDFFSRSGLTVLDWHASVVAARASLRAGDAEHAARQASRAGGLFVRLRESWGEGEAESFLARPDVSALLKELGGLTNAAVR